MTKRPKPTNYYKPIHPTVVDYTKDSLSTLREAVEEKCRKTNRQLDGVSRMDRNACLAELNYKKVRNSFEPLRPLHGKVFQTHEPTTHNLCVP